MTENPYVGSDFSDFLKQEGMYETVTAYAKEQVLAWQAAHAPDELRTFDDKMSPDMPRTK